MSEILEKIKFAVADGEEDVAMELVKAAIGAGIPPLTVLNEGAAKGMDLVGERYNVGEAFLPELVIAGDAMSAVMEEIMGNMSPEEIMTSKTGTVVIGQAKGDVHDIGKNVVAALLSVNGFEVHNLGTDVSVKTFIEKCREVHADIVAISTLLTTSLPFMADTVKYLEDSKLRDKVNIIVGGGPVTAEFAASIRADGWARSAIDAVELCKKIMQGKIGGQGEIIFVDSEK
ncbi:MAG: cobalamin-dependent protein [Synergistaceae bacterium]|nr:cobalamin-dependent protein [Synergistaceae bacterium]